MQTFLPFPSFQDSARALDMRRLGKQRVETYQILRALAGIPPGIEVEAFIEGQGSFREIGETPRSGWANHPAVRMWRGHEGGLVDYGVHMCHEWIQRGYRDTTTSKILRVGHLLGSVSGPPPTWFGDPAFHRSHRSNLLRKDPAFYRPLFPEDPDDLPYVWPVP